MLFDRYRKSKRQGDPAKKSSLADTLFRRLPHALKSWQHSNPRPRETHLNDAMHVPVIVSPRQSVSLPNIASFNVSTVSIESRGDPIPSDDPSDVVSPKPKLTPSISLPTVDTHRALKRNSADYPLTGSQRMPAKRAKSDSQKRHSLPIGRLTDDMARMTIAELLTVAAEIDLSHIPHPQRSRSHQYPTLQPKVNIPRAHSISSPQRYPDDSRRFGTALSPKQLANLLETHPNLILVDVRNLVDYQKRRIRGSFNVNLPSLLIKRYQRGTFSNFNMENFITTTEGRERYTAQMQQQASPASPSQPPQSPQSPQPQQRVPSGSILEQKAAGAAAKMKRHSASGTKRGQAWVVYDQDMTETQRTSPAWTLLTVLERALSDTAFAPIQVYYLSGGFQAFERAHKEHLIEGVEGLFPKESTTAEMDTKMAPNDDNSSGSPPSSDRQPRRSISYTVGDKSMNRRTSLFSLDTQAARANNANALARRAKRRSQAAASHGGSSDALPDQIHVVPDTANDHQYLHPPSLSQQHLLVPTTSTSASTASSLSHLDKLVEADDEAVLTDAVSPRTETDFEFVISEIIPGFLFVGPEIETLDHVQQLESRRIRRVLNMAEECDDEVLQGKMQYHKIAARDTVEMKNIDSVMMEAVSFIESAKQHHEPIYVHCKAGKSRSVTAILAYLVSSERWTLKKAYRHVIKARPNMSPNIGFIAELMKIEGRVHGRISSFIETDWQMSSMPSPDFMRDLKKLEYEWQHPKDATSEAHQPASPKRGEQESEIASV